MKPVVQPDDDETESEQQDDSDSDEAYIPQKEIEKNCQPTEENKGSGLGSPDKSMVVDQDANEAVP